MFVTLGRDRGGEMGDKKSVENRDKIQLSIKNLPLTGFRFF